MTSVPSEVPSAGLADMAEAGKRVRSEVLSTFAMGLLASLRRIARRSSKGRREKDTKKSSWVYVSYVGQDASSEDSTKCPTEGCNCPPSGRVRVRQLGATRARSAIVLLPEESTEEQIVPCTPESRLGDTLYAIPETTFDEDEQELPDEGGFELPRLIPRAALRPKVTRHHSEASAV